MEESRLLQNLYHILICSYEIHLCGPSVHWTLHIILQISRQFLMDQSSYSLFFLQLYHHRHHLFLFCLSSFWNLFYLTFYFYSFLPVKPLPPPAFLQALLLVKAFHYFQIFHRTLWCLPVLFHFTFSPNQPNLSYQQSFFLKYLYLNCHQALLLLSFWHDYTFFHFPFKSFFFLSWIISSY